MFNWSDYQNIAHFPPSSDAPRISMLTKGVCKCNISRVERGKGGRGIYDCHKPIPQANAMTPQTSV